MLSWIIVTVEILWCSQLAVFKYEEDPLDSLVCEVKSFRVFLIIKGVSKKGFYK